MSIIPLWAKLLVIGAILAGAFGMGWSKGSASTQAKWDLATAAQVKAQLAATERARATEQALQQRVNDANTAITKERAKHARIAADLKRDADSLRNDIASFASGSPGDSSASCGERAATLGGLLETALRTSETCAVEGESVSADLRAVLGAWPSSAP